MKQQLNWLKKVILIKSFFWFALLAAWAGFSFFTGDTFAADAAAEAGKEVTTGMGLLAIGAGLALGLSALGTGLAQSKIGAAGVGAMAEKPELKVLVIVLIAIPETLVILGFVVAAMIMTTLGG